MVATKYTYSINDTLNDEFNSAALEDEIRSSNITTALDYTSTLGTDIEIWFKDALSTGDETALDTLVGSHTGETLLEEEVKKVEIEQIKNINVALHKPQELSHTIVSHDFCDPCTWYSKSTQVVEEILSTENGLHFKSANKNWIDLEHGRVTYEDKILGDDTSYRATLYIDDVAAISDVGLQAEVTISSTTIRAKRRGSAGHVILTFNGSQDVETIVEAHNSSNKDNPLEIIGDGDYEPSSGGYALTAGDYHINHEEGDVHFHSSQVGKIITADYRHEDGSIFVVQPPEGKIWEIIDSEIQFSQDSIILGGFSFTIWVYNPEDLPNKIKYMEDCYKNFKDFINVSNEGKGEIILGALDHPVNVFPFRYKSVKALRADQGAELRIEAKDNTPVVGDFSTVALYILEKDI